MHHLTRGLLGVGGAFALGFAFSTPSHAQATINDCEKIQAADAYNQCLAKFGPTSKVKSLEPERPGDIKGSSEEAAAGAGARKGGAPAGGASTGGTPKGGVKPSAAFAPFQFTLAKPAPYGAKSTKRSRRSHVRGRSGGRVRMTFSVRRRRHR